MTGEEHEWQGRTKNCRSFSVPRSCRYLPWDARQCVDGRLRHCLALVPRSTVDQKPDGLLLHENFIMSLIPLHLGMRQYWRDFDALEAWARSTPHREWWRDFLRSSRGTGFWHEAYFMRGGMEAVYDDVPVPLGFGQFAPTQPARGPMFSARTRAKLAGEPRPAVVEEAELYGVASLQ
jgi:hypothetical protein